MDPLTHLPPQELEAEACVLGAALIDPSVISGAHIRPDDFYRARHSVIWSALRLMNERGDEIDLVTASSELREAKELATVGAASYLSELVSLVPTSANFKSHERLVVNAAQRRRVIKAASEATARAYENKDPEAAISQGITALSDIRRHEGDEIITYREMIARGYDAIAKRCETTGTISGIPTGFRVLDGMTDGLQPGELYLLAGRPAMGKTAMAMQFVRSAARSGRPSGVISIEMGEGQVALRELAGESGVSLSRMRNGELRPAEWDVITDAGGKLSPLPIFLAFESFTDRAIERVIDDMVQRLGCKIIMLDYIQLAGVEDNNGNREQEVSKISRMLKRKAKQHRIPIVALAQLNRALESRPDKRPTLADLRESGSLEQDADVIMFIYRDEVYNCKCPKTAECSCGKRGKAELLIRKGRMIMTGDVDLIWHGKTTTFTDPS